MADIDVTINGRHFSDDAELREYWLSHNIAEDEVEKMLRVVRGEEASG